MCIDDDRNRCLNANMYICIITPPLCIWIVISRFKYTHKFFKSSIFKEHYTHQHSLLLLISHKILQLHCNVLHMHCVDIHKAVYCCFAKHVSFFPCIWLSLMLAQLNEM